MLERFCMNYRKLIALYFYISERYEKELKYRVERFSTNQTAPEFSDAEVLTVYLFVMSEERRFQVKEIHRFCDCYLRSWFPQLPSYQAFDQRCCRLWEVLQGLLSEWLVLFLPVGCATAVSIVDSLPVITCSGKRDGKVAREITDKGYCSTKDLYFYGIRLHVMGWRVAGHVPWIERLVCAAASQNDLTIFKENWEAVGERTVLGDKIYKDEPFGRYLFAHRGTALWHPVKEKQGKALCLKQRDKAANDLFSAAVSRVRQPIESLFNWLIEKTNIQQANKVRSTKGLLLHVFGHLAAAILSLLW